jgi:hypothetical protein
LAEDSPTSSSTTGITFYGRRNLNAVPAFITKERSEIRELLAQRNSAIFFEAQQ